MNVKEAASILRRQFPERIITGYWVKDNGYVFNTKMLFVNDTSPGQYVVTNDGKVYGTNPVRSDLDINEMKKF